MIKKLQALKAKKGFTLVELIVVIAIIGVLAAILVPTMLGYVTSSRVTSANSTAASIKNNIDSFLTSCDTAGYGMLKGSAQNTTITIAITGGNWTATAGAVGAFKNGAGKTWATAGTAKKAGDSKASVANPVDLLSITLADLFPEINTGYIQAYVEGGKCLGVLYTADTNGTTPAITTGDLPSFTAGTSTTTGGFAKSSGTAVFGWNGSTAGVTNGGLIVGTAPVVALGTT